MGTTCPETMKTTEIKLVDPQALVREAFGSIKKHEIPFDFITDRLFLAAIRAGSLELLPSASGGLGVNLAGSPPFEVPLPFGLSRFRSILARIGTICNAASSKTSLSGRLRGQLQKVGILSDKYNTEHRKHEFSYRRCSFPPVPGSPLYALDDAVLSLRGPERKNYDLKVTMKNSPGKSFLKLELVST
jgi:hypothetical protein